MLGRALHELLECHVEKVLAALLLVEDALDEHLLLRDLHGAHAVHAATLALDARTPVVLLCRLPSVPSATDSG